MAHQPPAVASLDGLGADTAFGSDGRLWVVTVHDGHVMLRHSDDFGQTFSAASPVNKVAEKIMAETEIHPHVAVGPQGRIDVSWSHPLPDHQGINVRFATSADGGKTFTPPMTVNHSQSGAVHYIDTLEIDSTGRIWIAWIDGRARKVATAQDQDYRGFDLYYSTSDDGGQTFTVGHEAAPHSCECCRVALALTPDDRVAAFFRKVYPGQIRDHALTILGSDVASDGSHRVTFSDWHITACPEQGPGLAIGTDGVRHGVWFEASHGPAIWYGQLAPGQAPKHKLKIGGVGASHADVAVHDGTVWVAWNQISDQGARLMLRVSHDNGASFGAPRVLASSTGETTSPQLLVHDGHAYVAWNTAKGFRLVPARQEHAATTLKPLSEDGIAKLLAPPKQGKRIVALWALYCIYCGPDMVALAQVQADHPEQIQLVTVATDDIGKRRADIEKRLRHMDMAAYPAYAYTAASPTRMNYRIAPDWGGALPYTIVIDADGSRTAYIGKLDKTALQRIAEF